MALQHTYRPSTIDEIWGNEKTKKEVAGWLAKTPEERNHAVLFTGPSGCGKTTFARVIANALNCNGRDFAEIDTADFRGIDTIRAIKKQVNLKPSIKSDCRVWLLDEAHMIGRGGDSSKNEAQNALLKTLEDTPAHTYIILCTTDPQMLIKTIKGRCANFTVETLDKKVIGEGLKGICTAERKRVKPAILERIALNAQGHVRNSVVALDAIIGLKPEEQEDHLKKMEAAEADTIELCRVLLARGSWKKVSDILSRTSVDAESVRYAVAGYAKAVLMKSGSVEAFDLLNMFTMKKYIDVYELTAMCHAHVKEYGIWGGEV